MVTPEHLMLIVPRLGEDRARIMAQALEVAREGSTLTTAPRLAAFLAQVAHETGGFQWLVERGDDDYFKRYENRLDLGNTQKGDGPRFKGRGMIQITGRYNYARAGTALHLNLTVCPELAEQPDTAAKIAVWFWDSRKLSDVADYDDDVHFRAITRRINGGLLGIADRVAYWHRAREVYGLET